MFDNTALSTVNKLIVSSSRKAIHM